MDKYPRKLTFVIGIFVSGFFSGCSGNPLSVPLAPSDLQAVAASASQIALTWIDNSDSEDGFEIERKTGAEDAYRQVAIVKANETNYVDDGLIPATTYFYRVRAAGAGGISEYSNEATATTLASEAVDATPPQTSFGLGPLSLSNSTDARFGFTADEAGATFECRLDAGSWEVCASPEVYLGLSEGSHTFEVRARDTAGNIEETTASYTWTIDSLPPRTTITSAPSSLSNSTDARFEFTADEAGATFEYRLDAGSWEVCVSPEVYLGLSEGEHIFQARATDPAGNVEAMPPSYFWVIDTVPPITTLGSGPLSLSNSTDARFEFTADEAGVTFACRLDAGSWEVCASPRAYAGLSEGNHAFEVRAEDPAGNLEIDPPGYSWTIDVTLPIQTGWNPAPGGLLGTKSPEITFSLNEKGDCRWSLSDQAYGSMSGDCTGDGTTSIVCPTTGLSEGAEVVYIACRDLVGNADTGDSNRHLDYTVSGPPFQSGWNPPRGNAINTKSPTITFSLDENGDCRWSLSDQGYGSMSGDCTGDGTTSITCSTTGLSEGAEVVYIACRDLVGNADTVESNQHLNYTVDTVPPIQLGWNPPKGSYINTKSPVISFSLNENGDCRWSLSDQAYGSMSWDCTGDGTTSITCPTTGLSEGAEIVYIACRDLAGSMDTIATNQHINYTVDTTPPDTTITSKPPKFTHSPEASFGFSCNEGVCSFECRLDGAAFSPCSSPWAYSGLSEGVHAFEVRAGDLVGNVDPSPEASTWTILDTWVRKPTSISTSRTPAGRRSFAAVWTGTEMIVWGGSGGYGYFKSGGRFNPLTNNWAGINTTGPEIPSVREEFTAVWTGSEMIVWGGNPTWLRTGGRYNPVTDTWNPTNEANAPGGRDQHTAIWTGTEIIIWGGGNGYNNGKKYFPSTDTWQSISASGAPAGRFSHTAVWTGSEMIIWGGMYYDGSYHYLYNGGRYNPTGDSWQAVSNVNAPSARERHTAVWTGTEMIVWGGSCSGVSCWFNTGGRYSPAGNSWLYTSLTNAPSARSDHSAVWTGTEMIVWGGFGNGIDLGGRYNPANNSWAAINSTDPDTPVARWDHAAIWTGSKMIIWGGAIDTATETATGGMYDPSNDSWVATEITLPDTPTEREGHTAVWTGSEMIIWGGLGSNTGGRYNPGNDTWLATKINGSNTPTGRSYHTAVWTGTEMIVWGGNKRGSINTGEKYDPVTDTWMATDTADPDTPAPRQDHTAVWTGSEMIVWGGWESRYPYDHPDGARYDPATNSWQPMSPNGALSSLYNHTAVWTGSEMILWGGISGSDYINTGARYNPVTDAWQATTTTGPNTPSARTEHAAVWTGSEMIVWGGHYYDTSTHYLNTGGRYNPGTDSWETVNSTDPDTPTEREQHTAVWTGTEMIVWGGYNGAALNTGGRYNPVTDKWIASTNSGPNVPEGRYGHTAVWTGSGMIVWGGKFTNRTYTNTGGIYSPP
jgi:N-acetylneuraminic acid mutarotase